MYKFRSGGGVTRSPNRLCR